MKSSLTVAFTGTSSILQASFLPEITLDEECSCALLDLAITNNIINDNNDKTEKKFEFETVRIICDIISNSYINGKQSHIIHQFIKSTSLVKGNTFVEIPKHLNYFPVKVKSLHSIHISIVDENGDLVNVNGCDVICRINIKRVKKN